ncbi:MAG TPA: ADP-forming succinate--CoA ligase subunit beta [Thermomicrobiales bacterium]|nr:ADP-forming succinate--CoA ligase subunit beta [Thermomicrobiales bacterium]
MNLHEYQAAGLMAEQGIPTNPGIVATTPSQAADAFDELAGPGGLVAVKAQVHTGGRGKAGGIKLARSADEARDAAEAILGMDINGHIVRKVLIAPGVDIQREYYLGAILDRSARGITIMASAEGGVDIEEVAARSPEKIVRVTADRQLGLLDYQIREVAFGLGIEPQLMSGFNSVLRSLYDTYVRNGATLAEINPLVLTSDDHWLALDSKMTIDDNILPYRPDLEELRDIEAEDATELKARANGISFVKLDGDIGCVVNGAGLAMATMDAIKLFGGEPANFLDVGGGATADQVALALELVLADEAVKAILFNIFGGITRADLVAEGIVEARKRVDVRVPMVIRLVGTNQEEGRRILAEAGLNTVETMSEAAQAVVAAASGQAG